MVRDLRRLADTPFDVLVVGAGIYGVATAWDAAQRGLSVAIVDRADFGSGTSFNNLKTLHGGLRSLQAMNFEQMRLFIRERRALARIAPRLIRPLPFVIPTSRHPKRSLTLMRVALAINDAVARDRNDGLADPALHLPPSRVVSRQEALELNPVIAPDGVTGGAVWHDYQMINSDRVTLAFLLSAVGAGACAANYAAVTGWLRQGDRVVGAAVEDQLDGERFDIRASVVVNAAGAWAVPLLPGGTKDPAAPAHGLSRAMNLVVRPVVRSHACGGLARGRYLFLVPWGQVCILGTSHDAHPGDADNLSVSRWDLEAFLSDAREAFPLANLTLSDVRLVHRGLLPMIEGHDTHVKLLRESVVVDHARHGAPGLLSIHGVRYTTARKTAEDAVNVVFAVLGKDTAPECRTGITELAGQDGSIDEVLRQLVQTAPSLGVPLGAACATTGAEIVYAAKREMAVKLSDALIRRTAAGASAHPGDDAVERAAAIMARAHGWDGWRTQIEIAEMAAFYRLPRD